MCRWFPKSQSSIKNRFAVSKMYKNRIFFFDERGARRHTTKIDFPFLKCKKINAKEKEKEKEEKIEINLLKFPFFGDRKNCLRIEEIQNSTKIYGSNGDSSHPHETKNVIWVDLCPFQVPGLYSRALGVKCLHCSEPHRAARPFWRNSAKSAS